MTVTGNIEKMETSGISPVQYTLPLSEHRVPMNELIGKEIVLKFENRINCVNCGKVTKKAFGQGFCFNCFSDSPENAECIVRPEVCEGHLGKGRDAQWEYDHHVKEHYVYLAQSGGVKVGVTRTTQIPTRWIDQGAAHAIILAKVPYRKLAGLIEVELKKYYADKTNWQQMLKNELYGIDLVAEREKATQLLPDELRAYVVNDSEVMNIEFPVSQYPAKLQSVSFDKEPEIKGILSGIKGQYLIFADDRVMNVRSQSGYLVSVTY